MILLYKSNGVKEISNPTTSVETIKIANKVRLYITKDNDLLLYVKEVTMFIFCC